MKIPRPPTSPAAMHFATTPSKTRRKASLSQAFVPCAAEHRRVGDTVLDAELAEPAIGKVHLHIGAESSPSMLPRFGDELLVLFGPYAISCVRGPIGHYRLYIRLAAARARVHPARFPWVSSRLARARVAANAAFARCSARLIEPGVG
jgi:hypothetical protein